jgi:MarR family transcriptional regulator, 2-MHQ and catechol-resistance regulon repressor
MEMSSRDDQSLKLYVVLSKAYRAMHDYVSKHIQSYGLNPTEFAVLELLYHKGEQPLQQIGGKILLASGSITYVIDKLEKKELLIRKACPKDRRVTYAVITEKGKRFIAEMFPEHKKVIDQIMSVLTEEEKETAIRLIKQVGLHVKNLEI